MKLLPLAEIGIGLFLASPADEGILALTTSGLSLPALPVQGPATALVGAALIMDGFKKLRM